MAKCIDEATLLLNQANAVYSDICKIVNDTVDSMQNKVVIMKKSKGNTEGIAEMTPDNKCNPEHAGTNIKELNSIETNICANKTADDVIRFRIVSPDDTYATNVRGFTHLLKQNEHITLQQHKDFKGTGNPNPYIGINSKYTYKGEKGEQPFEIQFHTQWMSDAANKSHKAYKSHKAGSRKKQKKKRKTYRKRTK